jgi:hypothetical protein
MAASADEKYSQFYALAKAFLKYADEIGEVLRTGKFVLVGGCGGRRGSRSP